MVSFDLSGKVNNATWQHHSGWESLNTTIEGYWSISHSPPPTVRERQLSGCQPTFQALPYILVICFCISEERRYSLLLFVLLGEMVQQRVKRTNGLVVSETNISQRREYAPTSLLILFSLFPDDLSEDYLRVRSGFSRRWALVCWWLLLIMI